MEAYDKMSLVMGTEDFQHMLRILNTNVDGKQKVPYAIRIVKGVGRRLAFISCLRAGVDPTRRAGMPFHSHIRTHTHTHTHTSRRYPLQRGG